MPYRCRTCRKDFSVKADSIMQGSPLGYHTWLITAFLMLQSPKGISRVRLHQYLGVTQNAAWHLAHRIREAWAEVTLPAFAGPVEVDETYVGAVERFTPMALRAFGPY